MDHLPDTGGAGTTDKRTDDEDPEVGQSGSTLEDGGSQRAGGVHRRTRVADADEVDEDERQTDGETCKVVGGAVCL